jgi:hypothetical protein
MALDPFTLNIYLDPSAGAASGELYIDDYTTQNYTEGKSFFAFTFTFANGQLSSTRKGEVLTGQVSAEIEKLEIFGLSKPIDSVLVGGIKMTATTRKIGVNRFGAMDLYAAVVKVLPHLDLRADGWKAIVA